MVNTLGRLQKITDLRAVWQDEARHFTPWLAQEVNLSLLADTIGLDLELEDTERRVGPFSADILCKDTATDTWVLVENQLERTDHKHLGQLLTYAAGLDAVTIVWIADRFTDEHRATLDWLNAITEEDINFFGLEIELWRIGDSPIAPKFNIISKPNDWTKTVVATRQQAADITPLKQLQLEYWQALRERMEANPGNVKPRKPRPQHWMNFAIGRSGFHMAAVINTQASRIEVQLLIIRGDIEAYFNLLQDQQAEIEREIGAPLRWRSLPHRKRSDIMLQKPNTDPTDRSNWPRQHTWLLEQLEAFYRTFAPRIKTLDAADWVDDSEDLDEESLS